MLPFDSSLFGYKLVFMAELCLAEGLATYTLRKRKLFLLRVAAALVFVFAVAFFFPLFTYTSAYITVMFIFLFMITLLALKFCYREPWSNIIFCGITAYTVQHSAYSAYSFLTTLLDLDTFGVLMTMYDSRTSLSNQVVDEVRNYFGDKTFKTLIPRTVKLSEAPSFGMPVIEYAPNNKGAKAYRELAKEVMKRA